MPKSQASAFIPIPMGRNVEIPSPCPIPIPRGRNVEISSPCPIPIPMGRNVGISSPCPIPHYPSGRILIGE